jgi:UDP-N-acetylglucosamine pyrophosphorylase
MLLSTFYCRQPMVPVIDAADGRWLLTSPGKVMMKPGGHGAIWKLMHDQGEQSSVPPLCVLYVGYRLSFAC